MNPAERTPFARVQKQQPAFPKLLIALTAALLVSVVLNILLTHRVRNLTYTRSARAAEHKVKIGSKVPPISAKRLDGRREIISYQDAIQPTVLYIFTPSCSWCARNMDNFKTLVTQASYKYRFIGISLSTEGLAEYVARNDLKLPIYSSLSTEAKQAYQLWGTPQTMVISSDGHVLQNWSGAYVGDQGGQVEGFFHVTLPGLGADVVPK